MLAARALLLCFGVARTLLHPIGFAERPVSLRPRRIPRFPPAAALLLPAECSAAYAQLLKTSPILTKSLTSACLFGVSDVIAQAPASRAAINPKRAARFMATGLGSGVLWHFWYLFEESLTSGLAEQASLSVAAGVSLEQFVMCPLYFTFYLVPFVSLQNGVAPRDVPGEVRANLPALLVANAKLWTPANILIYSLPIVWRCLASNMVDVVWGVICSRQVNADAREVEACPVDVTPDEPCEVASPGLVSPVRINPDGVLAQDKGRASSWVGSWASTYDPAAFCGGAGKAAPAEASSSSSSSAAAADAGLQRDREPEARAGADGNGAQ